MVKKLILIQIIIISLFSCHKKVNDSTKIIKIGFSVPFDVFLQERWDRDIKIFSSRAKELGSEVIFAKSLNNIKHQETQILFLMKQDIDVLVIIPNDRISLKNILGKVNDKGIPILTYDRLIMGVPLNGFISFDNQEVGSYLSKALISHKPKGNYIILNGSIKDNNSFEVNLGVHKNIDPLVEAGDIKIIEEIWLNEWSYDEAFMKLSSVFDKRQDIDAISCANDMMAQAAIKVLAERRLAGTVLVVGQDADLVACQSIIEGTQLLTVYKPIHKLATRAAEIAVDLASGIAPEPELYINNTSGKSIPFYIETAIPVYKEQMMETVIKDGFHSIDDVYRDR